MKLPKFLNPAIIAIALVAVLVVVAVVSLMGGGTKTAYADFPKTVSLYAGSDVRIMGVAVGKVDSVTPMGTKVRVKFTYDDSIKVPADAKAVIISPSVVGDRFVQLTPGYTSGPTLADNAHLDLDHTAVPLELDEIFKSISNLTVALGPDGANASSGGQQGALSRLLDATAKNFGGQGVVFNSTLRNLGDLTKTLADNKDNLFSTQSSIEKFVHTLAANDDVVRQFNDSLAAGANLLASERQDLAATLDNLSVAMDAVRSYIHDNRDLLTTDIAALTRISDTLAARRDQIQETLHVAPLALNNLGLVYNGHTGTTDTRDNIGATFNSLSANPSTMLCTLAAPLVPAGQKCPFAPRSVFDQIKEAQNAQATYSDTSFEGLVAP